MDTSGNHFSLSVSVSSINRAHNESEGQGIELDRSGKLSVVVATNNLTHHYVSSLTVYSCEEASFAFGIDVT